MKIRANQRERAMIAAIIKYAPDYWTEANVHGMVRRFRDAYKTTEHLATRERQDEK